jgi:hypothetical protein
LHLIVKANFHVKRGWWLAPSPGYAEGGGTTVLRQMGSANEQLGYALTIAFGNFERLLKMAMDMLDWPIGDCP